MNKMFEMTEQMEIRKEKMKKLQEMGINPFSNQYKPENEINQIIADFDSFSKEELEEKKNNVKIAGRIMTRRDMGKAAFLTIKDNLDIIQIYVASANLTEIENEVFSLLDLGDIIYIEGEVMKTKVGAIAIRAHQLEILTKSIQPLPEKFHGLTDIEERYRKRYTDLIMNDDSKMVFINRSKIISEIRRYLNDLNYLEVETPTLQTIAGGAAAEPFITHHNALNIDMYMRIAPELYLKRLIVGGFNKVYEIGKNFRNEGVSIKHNPEFTSIEIYETYQNMDDIINLTKNLIMVAAKNINPSMIFNYQGTELDLNHFRKVHMVDLINEVVGVNFFEINDIEEAKKVAKEHNIQLEDHHYAAGHVINEFFEQRCEDTLIQPTFVHGHPVEISPLSRIDYSDRRFTERFELFIDKREYANGFGELNDPFDQLERFEGQIKESELGNTEANELDYDFVNALSMGMSPTGGLGIGIDRLVMLLTDSASIRDVILFPTMKNK